MKDKFEYEEVEEFYEELLRKEKSDEELKQDRLNAIYKNKSRYINSKNSCRFYQQKSKERS